MDGHKLNGTTRWASLLTVDTERLGRGRERDTIQGLKCFGKEIPYHHHHHVHNLPTQARIIQQHDYKGPKAAGFLGMSWGTR